MEMTTDLRKKDLHVLKGTSMKQQENPADFSSVHKVQDFFAQICSPFTVFLALVCYIVRGIRPGLISEK